MKFLSHSRRFTGKLEETLPKSLSNLPHTLADLPATVSDHLALADEASPLLKAASWGVAAVSVLAVGVIIGRELRFRYKFNRRTPYDFYAHSGDEREFDFGLGI